MTNTPDTTRPEGTPGDGATRERLRKGRTLEERRAERRAALLDSALTLFAEKGYGGTTIEEICRGAYVSTRNFYEEFANREELLSVLYDQMVNQMTTAVFAVDQRDPMTGETDMAVVVRKTRARLEAFVRVCTDDPRIARVALVEAVGVSPAIERQRRAAHSLFSDYIAQAARGSLGIGAPPDTDFRLLSIGMVGAINEILVDWALSDEPASIAEMVETMQRIFLGFSTYDPLHPFVAHHPTWGGQGEPPDEPAVDVDGRAEGLSADAG